MSKQRPILFNGDMVVAIDGDLKNQTRRTKGLKLINESPNLWRFSAIISSGNGLIEYGFVNDSNNSDILIKCPYGVPGNVLYVRETFEKCKKGYRYKSGNISSISITGKWKPSIHMPKEAARIWLQIVEVSVERLKEITQQGAKDEGVKLTQTSPLSSFIALWDRINGTGEFNSNPWVWVVKFKKIPKP